MQDKTAPIDHSINAKPLPLPLPNVPMSDIAATVEQNVKPVVTEVQQLAAQTSVSGRKAVSRGTIYLAFYLWLLSGAIMLAFIARRTDFFPGDKTITRELQKHKSPLFRGFMLGISRNWFPEMGSSYVVWHSRHILGVAFPPGSTISAARQFHVLIKYAGEAPDQTSAPDAGTGNGCTCH